MYVRAGSEASQKVKIVSCEVQIVVANNSSKFLTFYKIFFFMINLHTIFYIFFKTSLISFTPVYNGQFLINGQKIRFLILVN